MGKGHSTNLRSPVYGEIEGEQSWRAAARRYGVSASTSDHDPQFIRPRPDISGLDAFDDVRLVGGNGRHAISFQFEILSISSRAALNKAAMNFRLATALFVHCPVR